ncbi:hypothetical protein QBC41DRAFT_306797 [Cercophora samala]|uniref:Uncharacterized protein n=1 Tax=Cercophora samala TaxID=330535 RepID=A0AA39Z3S3_9PEZI|nr:hypothetical protein QBC41DRAFT_306797 [Cercophora samala]
MSRRTSTVQFLRAAVVQITEGSVIQQVVGRPVDELSKRKAINAKNMRRGGGKVSPQEHAEQHQEPAVEDRPVHQSPAAAQQPPVMQQQQAVAQLDGDYSAIQQSHALPENDAGNYIDRENIDINATPFLHSATADNQHSSGMVPTAAAHPAAHDYASLEQRLFSQPIWFDQDSYISLPSHHSSPAPSAQALDMSPKDLQMPHGAQAHDIPPTHVAFQSDTSTTSPVQGQLRPDREIDFFRMLTAEELEELARGLDPLFGLSDPGHSYF